MARFLSVLVLACGLLALGTLAASAGTTAASCDSVQDAGGNLVVTGTGLESSYYYGWGLYAEGVPVPAGTTPWLDYGYFWTAPDGSFTFTMGYTVAAYEGWPGAPYPLKFSVFGLHGSKDLIGSNRLSTDTGTLTDCTFTPGP